MLEVAQIARAYRSMRFINPKLTRALSRAFLSLDVGELNPLSVCNLLYDCMQLGIRQGKMTDRMVHLRSRFPSSSSPASIYAVWCLSKMISR